MLTEDQKKARLGKITSSLVAACLGRDERKTAIDAWLEITGRAPVKEWTEQSERAASRGNRLEEITLEYGAEVVGAARWEVPPFVSLPEYPWAGDSCDAVYYDDYELPLALGEAKTCAAGVAKQFGEEGTDEVPQRVYLQSLWHLIHHPVPPVCIAPTLQGGYSFEFRHYVIKRDEEEQGLLLQDLAKWHHDHVVMDIQPIVTGGDSEFLQMKYPKSNRELLVADAAAEVLALDTLVAKLEAADAADRAEDLCAKLKDIVGEHYGFRTGDVSVIWADVKDKIQTNYAAMVEEMRADYQGDFEALYTKHTRLVECARRLTVKPWKEKKHASC